MTTYQTDVYVTTQDRTRTNLGINTEQGGKLSTRTQPTQRTGSYGNNSTYKPPNTATQAQRIDGSGNYGNPMRNHVDVEATEVPGSKKETLGNRARVASSNASDAVGKTVKTVGNIAKNLAGKTSPVVGFNPKGDVDFGLRVAGAGISISVKGDVTLGVPGLSTTISLKNPSNTRVDLGFGVATIEQTRDGCSITVTVSIAGRIVNQDTRKADDCVEPEPTPTPTPTPTPSPTPEPPKDPPVNNDDLTIDNPTNYSVPSGYTGYVCPIVVRYTTSSTGATYEYKTDDGLYLYTYTQTTNIRSGTSGWLPAGGYYDLSLEESGKSKQSGYEIASSNGTIVSDVSTSSTRRIVIRWGVAIREGESLPKPFKFNGWWITQFVPEATYGYVSYFWRQWAQQYNEIAYTIGISDEGQTEYKCVLISHPYNPTINRQYENKPRGLIPPMENNCCDITKRIYVMLGGDDFYNEGIKIPNSLYVPGGDGETQAENYNQTLNLLFRTLAYRTPGEMEIKLKDSNIMKPGNQPLTYKPTNATSYFNKLMEVSMSQDGDLSALLNLLIRLNWIAVQILNLATKINYGIQAVLGFFAVPVKDKVEDVEIPVDPSLGQTVGFESKKPSIDRLRQLLDKDDPNETRSLLDKFMNNSKIAVTYKKLVSTSEGGNYWWLFNKNKK